MKSILITLINLCFCATFTFSQNIDYAKQVIAKLASPSFAGRGYTHNGVKKAAKFIEQELKKKDVNITIQNFNFDVNTFPSKMKIKIDGKELLAGEDYLVDPKSPSCKGKYELIWIDSSSVNQLNKLQPYYLSDKFMVIDTVGIKDKQLKMTLATAFESNFFGAAGIIEITDKKLVYTVSCSVATFPFIQIKRNSINRKSLYVELKVKNKFIKNYETENIIALLSGKTDTCIVFTAHYDHLGNMGRQTYFPGAHDNASGVATVLDLINECKKLNSKYSFAFIFFSGEEAGLLGSEHFVAHPLLSLKKMKFLINLDLLGSGEQGIKVVNGTIFKDKFDLLTQINNEKKQLKKIEIRGAARNSDHYYFYQQGVPCFFIYTLGAYVEYHNIYDRAESLPLPVYNQFINLMLDFVKKL